MTQAAPGPGVYESVPFEEYLAWPWLNDSTLRHAAQSLAHLKAAREQPRKPSGAMRLGSLCHAGRLEPEQIPLRYAVMPDYENDDANRTKVGEVPASPKATAYYREMAAAFALANRDKEIVSRETYDQILGVVGALKAHRLADRYFHAGGPTELSIVWDDPEHGIRCKARVDKWAPACSAIVDLKTTADLAGFERQIGRLAYHQKAAWYVDGLKHALTAQGDSVAATACEVCCRFVIAAAETQPPYCVRCAPMAHAAVEAGRTIYRRLLRRYAIAVERDEWPGPPDPSCWRLPAWAEPGETFCEISVGGVLAEFETPDLETEELMA